MKLDSIIEKYKLFWQYPVITEKTFYEQNKGNDSYIGFPWATLIDKRYNLNVIYKILHPHISSSPFQYTCCQHISFRKLIPLFKKLNIGVVYSPHKTKGEDLIQGITIKPCPLYAVNYEDEERNKIFQNVNYLENPRNILYSFQGAYNAQWYITDIRKRIFEMKHAENCFVKYIGNWHFEHVVYSSKQNYKYELNETDSDQKRTEKYNNLLLDSRYSLCPSGSGPNSIRFWESLAVGSIPILLSDTLELPENKLWKESILCVQEKDLVHIPDILVQIDEKKEKTMRQNCIKLYQYYRNNFNNYSHQSMTLFLEMEPSLINPYYKVFGHFFLDHLFMLYKIKQYYKTHKNIQIDSIYINESLLHIAPFIKKFYESFFLIHSSYTPSLNIITIGSIIGSVCGSETSNIYLSKTRLKDTIPFDILENGRKITKYNKNAMQSFTRNIKEYFIKETNIYPNNEVLIIDRKKSPRRLLNMDEMVETLRTNGYNSTTVTFDDIDLSQQINMVSKYKTIICACGSVQVHISFLRSDCTFIELCESGFRYPNTSIYGNFNNISTYSLTCPLYEKYIDHKMSANAKELFRSSHEMPRVIKNDIDSIEREKTFYSKLMSYNCFWIHTIQDINCTDHIKNIVEILTVQGI